MSKNNDNEYGDQEDKNFKNIISSDNEKLKIDENLLYILNSESRQEKLSK